VMVIKLIVHFHEYNSLLRVSWVCLCLVLLSTTIIINAVRAWASPSPLQLEYLARSFYESGEYLQDISILKIRL